MNSVDSAYYSQSQSASTPSSGTPDPKAITERFSGEKIKMSNSTPNGYSSVPSYKVKSDEHLKKHHDSSKNSDHKHSNSSHHNSDHTKRKEGDSSKLSSSSKPKDSLNKSNKSSNDAQKSKEHHDKKHEHSKSSSDKLKKEKSSSEKSSHDSLKKVDKHRDDKHKEKTRDGHSSEHKHKDKTKEHDRTKDDKLKDPSKVKKIDGHKDKPRDKSDKPIDKGEKPKEKCDKPKEKSDRPKEKSGDRPKERSDKPKEKIDKPKDKVDKSKDKPRDKGDKPKDKSDKPKEKSHDKPKEKSNENLDKSKDRIGDKLKDKAYDNLKDKKRESLPEKKLASPPKDHSKKISETPKIKPQPTSPVKSPAISELSSPLSSPTGAKKELFSDDDIPLSTRKTPTREATKPVKREIKDEESDDEPLSARITKVKKVKTEKSATKKRKIDSEDEDYEEYDSDYKKPKKKIKKETKPKVAVKKEETSSPKKGRAKKEDDKDVWKWWEEEKHEDGIKWRTLGHKGPVFAPLYERVPKHVKFYYDGKHMELSEVTEEVAGFYGRMLDHDYTTKDSFNTNFFKDWRKVMTPQERESIKDLRKCNFKDFDVYYKQKSEERKNMTKEQKQEIKKQNAEMVEEYGFCIIDGHRQKIGNFKIEPPGLFRGRGEHPKMGMLKRRVQPEDILINIGREAKVPEPPAGHKWKEIRHDNTVTWLASWNENILNSTKYIMLNPSSKLKGEKDWQKYETARKLKNHAQRIRNTYEQDFKSKEMKVRQRAVALYFIDKLALRAGNEKDEDTADTVGCCSLRVEHITLDEEKDGQEYVVSFDFLGKDSIRYVNSVPVEKRAFKNLKLFMENKQPGDDLFDRLNTSILNKYLTELMDGLTAKVFRTYNASKTLQEQLDLLTKEEMSVPEKLLAYNRANRSVAVLCNHQRAVPKTFDKSMENLKNKIDEKLQQIKTVKKEFKQLKSDAKNSGSVKDKQLIEKKKKRLQQLEEQLQKLEVQATDKEENKQIALGTSKLNYLDPRISVAWCKKWEVPIEKIYNRTQRDKFRWAIEMAGPEFKF